MKLDRTKRWLCSGGHFARRPDLSKIVLTKIKVKTGGVAEAPARQFYCLCGERTTPVRCFS